MKLIDISRPLHSAAPHWPGDRPTEFTFTARRVDGSSCNVGALSLSVHNGTHVDAPFHFNDRGATIEALSLDAFIGPARVVDARGRQLISVDACAQIPPADLARTPRILFRTDSWSNAAEFPASWPRIDPALPAWLASGGVKMVGVDFPSVDDLRSETLPVHHACDAAQILILENLDLGGAEPGTYELIALPLRISGGDASPIRAVLRTRD